MDIKTTKALLRDPEARIEALEKKAGIKKNAPAKSR